LHEHGWKIEPDAKLFAQVNQSEMLSEFLNVILGRLNESAGDTASLPPPEQVAPREPQLHTSPVPPRGRPSRSNGKARLLFIHGLGGHPTKTWSQLPSFLLADGELAERYEPGFYSFPTSLIRLPFSSRAPKVQELAAGLRTQIEHDDLERVDLVCHSLGGLIARRYLIEEVKASRPLRVERLALCAVPNNGSGLASVGQMVSWRHGQIAQLCRDADLIEFLNEDWFHFNVQDKVRVKFVVGTQDKVVDRFSVAGYWGNPDVETIVGRGHIDLVKPDRPDDLLVKVLRRFLLS
jgi:pimeloyl-ACP methyl ester carboxylesterase